MGILDKLRFAGTVAAQQQKGFSYPPIWSPIHPLNGFVGSTMPDRERIDNDYMSYVEKAFKANGPIFALCQARQMAFAEARFQFRRYEKGRPAEVFGQGSLRILERPWASGTTGELLSQMLHDADLAGNSYWTIADDRGKFGRAAKGGPGERLVRIRPDWATLVLGSHSGNPYALDTKVVGLLYEPRTVGLGIGSPAMEPVLLLPGEFAHFSPIPDPAARFRGMSWLTPVLREIEADQAATIHKKSFLENAAVPNMVVKFDKDTAEDAFEEFVEGFQDSHQGAWNAYKTLFLMGGADVTALSHDFRQMEFNQSVGKGESRLAAAAGVPPAIVGFSEGLQGSALNAGNFSAARRRFADLTIRPLWRMAAASLEPLVDMPDGAHLWYDSRDAAFLREDEMDRAEIFRIDVNAVDAAIKAGYEDDAAVEAARDRDINKLLGRHTGLVSVQMQPPSQDQDTERTAEEVAIRKQEADIIVQLTGPGGFELDSVIEALDTGDWEKLKKDPLRERQQEAATRGAEESATQVAAAARGQQSAANQPNAAKPPKPPGGDNAGS